MRTIVLILTLMSLSAAAQELQENPPGLKVGTKAPDFELKDQLGKTIQLSKLLKTGPVASVFHRSAEW